MSPNTPPDDKTPPEDKSPPEDPTLRAEWDERSEYITRLEQANTDLERRIKEHQVKENSHAKPAAPTALDASVPSLAQIEETLKRLVDRICRFLQAEKCVFLLHDPIADTLYATHPAYGFAPDELHRMERRVGDEGLSSHVFRTHEPRVTQDAATDERARAEGLADFGVRNAISVPLIVEKRDDDNRVTERNTVGVLHVFNKIHSQTFEKEDIVLLERMAKTAGAISSARIYREIVQEEQGLVHTVESLQAGLLMVSMNRRLAQINPSARAILGIPATLPIVNIPYSRAIPNSHVRHLLEKALSEPGSEVTDEIAVPVKDPAPEDPVTERIFQVQCATVRDAEGKPDGVFAIFNDITDIRGVERMKTAFISTVSHELRTPLTGIKGFISTLISDTEGFYDEPTKREFYGIIDTECDRLTRLINDLLDISRIEQGRAMTMRWEEVNIPALVEKVIAAQRPLTRNHTLSLDFPPDFPLIEADADKIDQILTNLVNNAIKYSPRGGAIVVSGRVLGDDGHHAPRIALRVSDEGMGIAPEHLPRLFERFYRVDNRDNREIGGTGIGLALVKALTEGHGGTAHIESELGRGTTFTVVLPVTQPDHKKMEMQA